MMNTLAADIISHTQTRKRGMAKFVAPPPFGDGLAVQYINEITGKTHYFHLNGKYWGYCTYETSLIQNLKKAYRGTWTPFPV